MCKEIKGVGLSGQDTYKRKGKAATRSPRRARKTLLIEKPNVQGNQESITETKRLKCHITPGKETCHPITAQELPWLNARYEWNWLGASGQTR